MTFLTGIVAGLVSGVVTFVFVLGEGVVALLRIAGSTLPDLPKGRAAFTARLAGLLTSPEGLRDVMAVLRAFSPNLVLKRRLAKAYDSSGTAIVTRDADVREVLERDDLYEVVYEPRMRRITDGENFFLGMANTARYERDTVNMRAVMRRSDVAEIVLPAAGTEAERIVSLAGGRMDVPQELGLRIPARMVAHYFGTPGPSEDRMIEWATLMFWYLFTNLPAVTEVDRRALEAAAGCRAYLDDTIAARKAAPGETDGLLTRCLHAQASGVEGMSDLDIRNNLIGLVIGAIPTINNAACRALNQLLSMPIALAGAQRAARAGDDAELAAYVFEALRFDPPNPVIYRRAVRDATIARGTMRARTIPAGTMVFAANLSAMFDPAALAWPQSFRATRAWDRYILWGYGLHSCFGQHINRAVIPALLKPLLARPNLRPAEGPAGRLDKADTPFPVHMTVEFDG